MNLLVGTVFILIACFLAVILRQQSPAFSLLLSVAAAAIALSIIVKGVSPYINELRKIFSDSGLNLKYFFTVLEGVAICYISRFAADICKDNGQTALSNKAEMIGKVSLLALSLPFLKEILDIALSLLV